MLLDHYMYHVGTGELYSSTGFQPALDQVLGGSRRPNYLLELAEDARFDVTEFEGTGLA